MTAYYDCGGCGNECDNDTTTYHFKDACIKMFSYLRTDIHIQAENAVKKRRHGKRLTLIHIYR